LAAAKAIEAGLARGRPDVGVMLVHLPAEVDVEIEDVEGRGRGRGG
jgi:hypothetical protein